MIKIRISSIKGLKPKITIGIMGCEPGMGVTHLSVALSHYLAAVLGMKTALVELGERNALAQLSAVGAEESFCLKGVTYFPQTRADELGQVMMQDFSYIVLDLGRDSRVSREELLRCDGRIIIGSLCPWRKNVYYDYMKRMKTIMGNIETCTFLSLFGDKVENKEGRRICKVLVKSIPFIADPFRAKGEEIPFLHSLL